MINGNQYIITVEKYFSFLISEYNMSIIDKKIRGNSFYEVQYGDPQKIISISYENIESYFQVIIFKLQDGQLPGYDDKTKTLHLDKLNKTVFSIVDKKEIVSNSNIFEKFQAINKTEKLLLKSAIELRMCLRNTKL